MIPKCERHWELLSSGTVYYAVEAESNLVLSLKSSLVNVQVIATNQFFSVVLFVMLHKAILTC